MAAVLDIVSTYIASPDLSHETNRIVVMLGRKWTYVIALKVVASLFAVVAFAGGLRILQSRVDRLKGTTGFVNVLSHLVFKRRVSLGAGLLYGWPKDWIAVFAVVAITIATTIVVGDVTAAILNTFEVLRSLVQIMPHSTGSGTLGIGIALWLTYQFFVKQRKVERIRIDCA